MSTQVDMDAIEQEVRLCFIQEDAPEYVELLEQGILALNVNKGEVEPESSEWRGLLRAVHSLKGGAALSHMQGLSQLAHRTEDLLEAMGEHRVQEPEVACHLLMQSVDEVRQLLDQVTKKGGDPVSELTAALEELLSQGVMESRGDAPMAIAGASNPMRIVLETDFKDCLDRAENQIAQAPTSQIPNILDNLLLEAQTLAEILNISPLIQVIQQIQADIATPPDDWAIATQSALQKLNTIREELLSNSSDASDSASASRASSPQSSSRRRANSGGDRSPSPANPARRQAPRRSRDNASASPEPTFNATTSLKPAPPKTTATVKPITATAAVVAEPPPSSSPSQSQSRKLEAVSFNPAGTSAQLPELTMRVPVQQLDYLSDTVGDLLITYEGFNLEQQRLDHTNRSLKQRIRQFYTLRETIQNLYDRLLLPTWGEALSQHWNSDFDPLEMDRFTDLHTLLQDVQEFLARIEERTQDIDLHTHANQETGEQFRKQLDTLRHNLTKARMVPFSTLAERFRRPLWNLNQRFSKSVRLRVEGSQVPVDRAVLDQLYEPMLHLIRNAFDHGIESTAERVASQKSAEGEIILSAVHQGTQVAIAIHDDGRGIDINRVQQRAIEQKLLRRDSKAKKQQILDCLFAPGFSTAKQVGELSGRGVGLDVVKVQIERLRGSIQLQSQLGKGTQFTLLVPMTLSILPLLVCQRNVSSGRPILLGMPTSQVIEMVEVPNDADFRNGLAWRDRQIRMIPIEEIMQPSLGTTPSASPTPRIAAVMEVAKQTVALGIDVLLSDQEMVLKPFDPLVTVPLYIAGCTVSASGQLIPVLAPDLLHQWLEQTMTRTDVVNRPINPTEVALSQQPPSSNQLPNHEISVLVVDDSTAVRRLMSRTLEQSGYQVVQCRDGQDALERLVAGLECHLAICDIEMPRLDGFQLLQKIRQHPKLAHLPVAMLTSRQGDRHRQQAEKLGANGYFIKPLGGQELIQSLRSLL